MVKLTTLLYCHKLTFQRKNLRQRSKKSDTTAMKQTDNIRVFCTALEAKLTAGAPEETRNLDETWTYLKTALHDAAVESFGIKRLPRKDRMAENADILEPLLSIKNKAHKNHINKPTRSTNTKLKEACCQFQKAARSCANNHCNILCDEIQQAADVGDLREMYRGLRKATGPSAKKVCPLKSTTGELITDSTKQLERWVEHYSVLYGELRNITAAALASTPGFDTMVELDDMPTMSEVKVALKHTSAGKAPGTDEILADLLKCDNRLLPHLYNLLCISWRSGKFPTAMKDAKIVTLYKKGNKGDCNSYRGIILLSVTGKVFARVLLPRLQNLQTASTQNHNVVFAVDIQQWT